jgi:hypothetical protein
MDLVTGTSRVCTVVEVVAQPKGGNVSQGAVTKAFVPKVAVGGGGGASSASSSSGSNAAASYSFKDFVAAAAGTAHYGVEPADALTTLLGRLGKGGGGGGSGANKRARRGGGGGGYEDEEDEDEEDEGNDDGGLEVSGAGVVPDARQAAGKWRIYAVGGPLADSQLSSLEDVAAAKVVALVLASDAFRPAKV